MKIKGSLLLVLLLHAFLFANAQIETNTGTVLESLTLKSNVLGKELKYSVYLPSGYCSSTRSYPVLYLLHGYTDDETSWIQFGEVNSIADRLFGNNEATPMIIVMPDAGLS